MRGDTPPRWRATQFGISLVETLVALALGLAMVSVAFNLYVSNRSVFRQIEGMVRLQESASIATALLEADIRNTAGTLCRNSPPTTSLLAATSPYWETSEYFNVISFLGLHGYESITTDPIVGSLRLAGDSISIMSDNMGKVARVTAPATYASSNGGLKGSYTFPVDNGLDFPVGTVAAACDYTRAVLFQVTESTASTIKLQANEGPALSPGNCAVTMRRERNSKTDSIAVMDGLYSCYGGTNPYPRYGTMYTFGPGSMIGEHTFHHWYVGKNASTNACCSLRRLRVTYSATGVDSTDEEMVDGGTNRANPYQPGQGQPRGQ
ncbi:MAG: hypothetical protein EBR89_01845 [Betaproteobacteria bacterium]|nr:hypothetical protein [Betaproteobacteria bacterium]